MCFLLCLHLVQGSGFKDVVAALPPFLLGDARKWLLVTSYQSQVTSHSYDTSRPLEKGRAEGAGWICPAGASFYVADNALLAEIVFLYHFYPAMGIHPPPSARPLSRGLLR